ncbi:MAG: RNA polymerase sigma factor [Actinomycetota bacterium]
MTRENSDAALIRESLGAPDAFAGVFDRHFGRICRFLRRRLPMEVADDLAAETFTRAFSARSRYDQSRPDAAPWLLGIASNLIREHLRVERRELMAWTAHASANDHKVDEGTLTDERLDAAAWMGSLGHALAQLQPAQRDALLLYAWEDLSYSEIATALSMPLGTVRSALHRARANVKTALRGLSQSGSLTVADEGRLSRG